MMALISPPQPPSAPTLRERKGGWSSPSPQPPSSFTRGEEGGTWDSWSESMLEPPHAMVARVWYVPNEKAEFLIRLLGPIRITCCHVTTDATCRMDATRFTISLALQELLRQKSLKTTCRDAHAFDALAVSSAGVRHTGVEAPPRGTASLCPYVWIRGETI